MTTLPPDTPFVITIDGPAGSGKDSAVRCLLPRIPGLQALNTGAFYRLVAYALAGRSPTNAIILEDVLSRIYLSGLNPTLDGKSVETSVLYSPDVSRQVSAVSAVPRVRECLGRLFRKSTADLRVVANGRDMGTRVFPDATLKIYLDAPPTVRAKRLQMDRARYPVEPSFVVALADVLYRDKYDSSRLLDPLAVPKDAIVIDTTTLRDHAVADTIALLLDRVIANPIPRVG